MNYQQVERRQGLTHEQFLADFARPEKPVIVTDLTSDWPAQKLWTFDYFRQHYASPYYLASWDFMLEAPELADHFSLPSYWREDWLLEVAPELRPRMLWLFIGPANTGFRLHVDVGHTAAWNVQLVGFKRWTLFDPEQLETLYSGAVDTFHPDLETHPKFAQASGYQCLLGPGEAIFVPSKWWHQTQILENSLAVSGNYANAHNIHHVLAWLRQHPEHAALCAELTHMAATRP
ncbi:cupin-like domain-containing protein [bacterium]|nr:cupin-like domain-containing protein [bacterium]